MKTRTIKLLLLLFLITASTSTIYAQTICIGTSTFTIPEGYIINENDTNHVKISNENISIDIYTGDKVSLYEIKKKYEIDNEILIDESTYIMEGIEITQQNYASLDLNTVVYSFRKMNTDYVITLNIESYLPIPEKEDNPVNEIIHSLQ